MFNKGIQMYCLSNKSDNFNELFIKMNHDIFYNGNITNPRGFVCREIIAAQYHLLNPLNCLLTLKQRKLNYAFSIIEKFTYLSQISVPDILISYNSNMQNFINNITGDFDGAYGIRIAKNNQLDWCYKLLLKDKDTRQAIITINDYTDRHESKDIACTLSLQFLIRNNKLDLIVNMRSNDLFLGTSYDIPAFCFLQEVMAYWLNIELGNYIHHVGSLHYYDNNEESLKQYIDYKIKQDDLNNEVLPLWTISYNDTKDALNSFWLEEKNIRQLLFFNNTKYDTINNYLKRLLQYWSRKNESKNT